MAPVEAFLERLAREAQLSPRTVEGYRRDLARFHEWWAGLGSGAGDYASLTAHDLRAFVAAEHGRGLGSKSIARALAALRSFFRYLIQEADLPRNPAEGVRPPRGARRLPRTLDVDVVKIDGSYIDRILWADRDRALVLAIQRLCSELGIQTVAEKVEMPDQAQVLRTIGIDKGQGWLFGKPDENIDQFFRKKKDSIDHKELMDEGKGDQVPAAAGTP